VRQGGILSPFLFNVYVDDLSTMLNECQVGCSYSGTRINHLMYADDLALIVPSISGLQDLVNICAKFGLSHDINFNVRKSAVMQFRSKLLHKVSLPSVFLNNDELKLVHTFKYLGHILTADLTDDLI